jgi:nitrite reductase/ring-hydroxylating ferredoxin subunit
MGIFKRLFGICETKLPANSGCWTYADGKLEVSLDKAPELSQKGGAVRLEGPSLPKRVLVVHGQDGAFHAFPNRCTHLGHRRIDPVPEEDKIRCCSVGKSTFEYSGKLVSGSAKESLEPLAVESEGSKLIISVA